MAKGREKVSPCWFMEEMGKRKFRSGGKDGKPKEVVNKGVSSLDRKIMDTFPSM